MKSVSRFFHNVRYVLMVVGYALASEGSYA
jgi:hypothetical protein